MAEFVSQFQDDVDTAVAGGMDHYLARQRAVDNYRRFTSREISSEFNAAGDGFDVHPDAVLLSEGNWLSANLSAESVLMFKNLFRDFYDFALEWDEENSSKYEGLKLAAKYVARLARILNLEHLLDDDLQEVVSKELGDTTPWFKADLVELCGYGMRDNRRVPNKASWHWDAWENALRSYAKNESQDYYERKGA
jgi:hypothetical protein